MGMMFRRLSLVLLTTLLAAACSTESDGNFAAGKVLTEKDAGIVLLSTNNRFSVRLPSNPSTGFLWKVAISNEGMLIRQGMSYYTPDLSEGSDGSRGGTETFTYRVVSRGRTTMQFVYWNPLEKVPPAKVVTYNVVVN